MQKIYLVDFIIKKNLGEFKVSLPVFNVGRNKREKYFLKEHFDDVTAYIIPKSKQREIDAFEKRLKNKFNNLTLEHTIEDNTSRYILENNLEEFKEYVDKERKKFKREVMDEVIEDYCMWVELFMHYYESVIDKEENKTEILEDLKRNIKSKEDMKGSFVIELQAEEMDFLEDNEIFNSFTIEALSIAYKRTRNIKEIMENRNHFYNVELRDILLDVSKINQYNINENPILSNIAKDFKNLYDSKEINNGTKDNLENIEKKTIELAQDLEAVSELLNLN